MSEGKHFLDIFFNPKSVALIGATNNMEAVNFHLVGNLVKLGFKGDIYPVNPTSAQIMGLKCYPDIKSINNDIDIAVISVPAGKTLEVVRDCIAKKVKGITITAGGFSETGSDGKKVQDELKSLLKNSGIRTIGPNALSPINSRNNFVVGFGPVDKLPQGRLSFIFQSGLYQPRINWLLSDFHLNLSKLIDLGNKMDVNEVDALEYLAQDEETGVIAIHMESIAGDAREFLEVLKKVTKIKPVIVLKSGRTSAGAKAASSHTGAIIKSGDAVMDVALRQGGAVRAQGLDDFFDMAKAFEYLPPLKNNRVLIGTFPGGEAVITADACQLNGLTLGEVSAETKKKLEEIKPPWDTGTNPYDLGVGSQFYPATRVYTVLLSALMDDPNVDSIVIQSGPTFPMDSAKIVKLFAEVNKSGKPLVTWIPEPEQSKDFIRQLEANRVPVFASAERAVKALGGMYRYQLMHR